MRAKERKVLTLILIFAWAAGPFSRGSQIARITNSEHDVLSSERKFKILRDSGVFSLKIDQSKIVRENLTEKKSFEDLLMLSKP